METGGKNKEKKKVKEVNYIYDKLGEKKWIQIIIIIIIIKKKWID